MNGASVCLLVVMFLAIVGGSAWVFSDTPEVRAQKLAASRNHELVRTCMRGRGSPKLDAQGVLKDCDYDHKHGLKFKME